jgi:circadian clock protein KaiC
MERIKTGINGLDEMLGGGFLNQSANLVEGAPGTGKSTLGMQFIFNGIAQFNQPGLILTFEEFPQQYYEDAANFGWDFRALEHSGDD